VTNFKVTSQNSPERLTPPPPKERREGVKVAGVLTEISTKYITDTSQVP